MFNAEYFSFLYRPRYFFLGIFAYLNFCVPRKRKYILELLISGLQRLEYRGYDSAGSCVLFVVLFTVFFLMNP